jgi:hypothetical protein
MTAQLHRCRSPAGHVAFDRARAMSGMVRHRRQGFRAHQEFHDEKGM